MVCLADGWTESGAVWAIMFPLLLLFFGRALLRTLAVRVARAVAPGSSSESLGALRSGLFCAIVFGLLGCLLFLGAYGVYLLCVGFEKFDLTWLIVGLATYACAYAGYGFMTGLIATAIALNLGGPPPEAAPPNGSPMPEATGNEG